MRLFSQLCVAVTSCALCAAASGDDAVERCTQASESDSAITACTELLAKDANNADAHAHRARVGYYHKCVVSKQFCQEAVDDFTKALELTSDRVKQADLYISRGDLYEIIKKPDLAVADYTKAIELDPTDGFRWCARSWFYENAGDKVRAEADSKAAERALAATGGGPEGQMNCDEFSAG